MREASARTGPMSMKRQVPNGKPSFETSASVIDCSRSRARGPQTPIVAQLEVRSVICTAPSSGRWSENHLRSRIPSAPPVTTRKWFEPSRMTVRSALIPPDVFSSEV